MVATRAPAAAASTGRPRKRVCPRVRTVPTQRACAAATVHTCALGAGRPRGLKTPELARPSWAKSGAQMTPSTDCTAWPVPDTVVRLGFGESRPRATSPGCPACPPARAGAMAFSLRCPLALPSTSRGLASRAVSRRFSAQPSAPARRAVLRRSGGGDKLDLDRVAKIEEEITRQARPGRERCATALPSGGCGPAPSRPSHAAARRLRTRRVAAADACAACFHAQREQIAAQREAIARQRAALESQQTEVVQSSSSARARRPCARAAAWRCRLAGATGRTLRARTRLCGARQPVAPDTRFAVVARLSLSLSQARAP